MTKSSEWTDDDVASLRVRGVALATFVDVHERVSAGVPLQVALAQHGIELDDWVDADADLAALLAQSVAGDHTLVDAFDRAFLRARSERERARPDVLTTDLAAFAEVVGHVRGHRDPGRAAQELGVEPSRLARAFGAWATRLEAEPSLGRRLLDLVAAHVAASRRRARRPELTAVDGSAPGASQPPVQTSEAPRRRRRGAR